MEGPRAITPPPEPRYPKPPSLEIAFQEAKTAISAQDAQIAALDSKASFILGSSSLITASIMALQGALRSNSDGRAIVVVETVALLAVYLVGVL